MNVILSVNSKKFDNIIASYKTVREDSKQNAEEVLKKASNKYLLVPGTIKKQVTKIVSALETYRTGTMKKRIEMFKEKQDDFEKAGEKIKKIFGSFEENEQISAKISSSATYVQGEGIGKFTSFVIDEKDLPKYWKATSVDVDKQLSNITAEQTKALTNAAEFLKGKFNMEAVVPAKISSYMVSIALPSFESTIYKMVKVYLNAPEKFEIDFNMPMYYEDEFGQAELNVVGILADMLTFEYDSSPVSISESFNEAYNAFMASFQQSSELGNAYINSKNINIIQKIKLEETEKYSSENLSTYSTAGLSEIFQQINLNDIPARIELLPTSNLTLTSSNEDGYYDLVLEEPMSFAVLDSDDNGFEVFGWGNFYYVKFEDMEIDKTPFNLYYTA